MNTYRQIFRLVRFRPVLWATSGLLASVMFYVFPLVPGLIIRQFFDVLTHHGKAGFTVTTLLALVVAAQLTRTTALTAAIVAENTVGLSVAALVRKNLLQRILERPGATAVPYSAGEAVSRFRDDVKEIQGFVTWIVDPVGQMLVFAGALVLLSHISVLITFAVFLPLVSVLALVNAAHKRVRRYRKSAQEGIGEVTNFLGEMFGAVLAVKVAGAERRTVEHFRAINEVRRRATLQDVVFTQILQSVSFNAGNLGTGVLLLVAASAMRTGTFSIGDFALFVSYIGWLSQMTGMFGRFLAMYRQTGVSLDRLQTLLQDSPPESLTERGPIYLRGPFPDVPFTPRSAAHRLDRLEVRGLTFQYENSDNGIRDVDLTIERGSFVVVTGRIGSGKSALLRVLLGLLPRESGEILWNGEPIDRPENVLVPPRVAYTSQSPRLFSESLRDNILLGIPAEQVDLEEAVAAAALARDVTEMDAGFDTLLGPRGVRLSGGQVQRTAAARMFVRDPELFVFDDLSSALDVETEADLWKRLAGRAETTCLVVSHRRPALTRADTIVVLRDGQIEDTGTLKELLQRSSEMQDLWHGVSVSDGPPAP